MSERAESGRPGIAFEPGALTLFSENGETTRIPAENISEITARDVSPADELIELTIECRSAKKMFIANVVDHPLAFDGLGLCLRRYPGFDFDWQTRLPTERAIVVYRTYADPIT